MLPSRDVSVSFLQCKFSSVFLTYHHEHCAISPYVVESYRHDMVLYSFVIMHSADLRVNHSIGMKRVNDTSSHNHCDASNKMNNF